MKRFLKGMTRGRIAFWVALCLPWIIVAVSSGPHALFWETVNGDLLGSRWGDGDGTNPYQALANQHPQDVQVQVSVAEDSGWKSYSYYYEPSDGRRAFAELEKVGSRFPQEVLPCAEALRLALIWMRDLRNQDSVGVPTFNRAQLQRALKIARHGQRLEPDNAYFDWVLVCLLLAGQRDAEAVQTLHSGSLKTHYDDHSLESASAAIHTSELVRPLSLEHKLSLCQVDLTALTTHYRHATRLLSWRAWKLERVGQHREAIALRAELARMAALLLRDHNTVETQKVSGTLQIIAWGGNPQRTFALRQLPPSERTVVGALVKRHAQSFAQYARAHGNETAALEATRFAQATTELQLTLRRRAYDTKIRSVPLHNDTLLSRFAQTRALFWFGVGFLWLIPLFTAGYIALSFLLIRTSRRPDETVPRTLPLALLCVGVMITGGLILVPTLLPSDFSPLIQYSPPNPKQETSEVLRIIFCFTLFFLTPIFVPAIVWTFKARSQHRTWRQAQPPTRESPLLPPDMRPRVWAFLLSSVALGTLLGFGSALAVWLMQPKGLLLDDPFFGRWNIESVIVAGSMVGTSSVALWFGGWLLKWRFFMPREERHFFHGALRRYRLTFSTLLILCSWTYLLLFWLSLIPRHHAEQLLVTTLHEGVAANLPAYQAPTPQSK